jgi:hypothetical protein
MKRNGLGKIYNLLYKEREKWAGFVQDWYVEAERHEERI